MHAKQLPESNKPAFIQVEQPQGNTIYAWIGGAFTLVVLVWRVAALFSYFCG